MDVTAFLEAYGLAPAASPTVPNTPATAEERTALANAFAAPPVLSPTGDDLRKVAAFTDQIKGKVDSARAILNMVQDEARQLQNLVDAQLAALPLGIKQTVGNTVVYIAIAEARLTPSAAEVDIYLSLDLPDTDQDPIFLAKGVGWSRQGGFVGEIELELIADWGIDFNAGRSRLILRADDGEDLGGTFVRINCDGFVAGRINASVLFSRNWVIPVVDGEPLTDDKITAATTSDAIYSGQRVQADFTIDIDTQNGFDFLAQMQVPMPFVFKGKEQVEVTIGIMAIDLSDVVNPTGMSVPPNYVSPHGNGPGALAPTWQGFYLAGLEIKLPEKLSKAGNPPIEIGAPYLIIDKMGITVHLYATNLLPLGEKSADGWAFSVDRVDLKITANQFEEAGIEGKINVPLLASAAANCGGGATDVPSDVLDPNDCLLYDALFIAGGDIYFTIESQTDYCADLWKAEVIIEANSRLNLALEDGEFLAGAMLFGSISVDAQINDNFGFTMDELSFDSLVLSNRSQYFSPGVWDFPDAITAQFGAFSLGFEHIEMALDPTSDNTDGRDVALSFQAWFNLDTAMDIDVRGAFQLLGYLNQDDGRQKWRFKRLKVNALQVEASTDSWSLGATIAFYENDSQWGTGFYGSGHFFMTMLGGDTGIAAVAQFGTAPDGVNKYFFIDIIARLGSGIPIAGGIKLMAIGGGVYTNMSRVDGGEIQSFEAPDDGPVGDAASAVADAEDWDGEGSSPLDGIVGISTSGIAYEVDPGNKFGAFLQIVLAGPSAEAFSVNARLELIVEDSGAWQARIDGNIMVMAPVNYTNEYKIEGGIGIFVNMAYTHSENYKGFQASADVFVDVFGIIKGGNDGNPLASGGDTNKGEYIADDLGYAGGVSMEFSTDRWYVHIGHPTAGRIALDIGVGPITVGFSSYFCIGQLVPPIPPLPSNLTAITGDIDMSRDFAQYENASGFAFGSSLDLEADGKFLIFYFEVAAGIGFDINIRKYGDAICAGGGPNAPAIGVNGWYAAGQAWAYVSGSIGIDVKLVFVTVRKEILSAGIAAVLQMKGPNPTWARGTLAGYYSILGGLFSGSFNIDAEFGENCVITGRSGEDPFATVDILSGLTPDDDAESTDGSVIPTGYLIMPLNEETELGPKKYRVMWLETKLRKVYNGYPVAGTIVKTPGTYSIQFIPDEFLDGETEYEIKVKVMLQSRPLNSGPWTLVKNEELVHRFTTAPAETLNPGNIAYSYPLQGQANFYRMEYGPAYLKLKRTQPTLTHDVTAVYTAAGSTYSSHKPVTFNAQDKEYNWSNGLLQADKLYKMEFIQYYVPPTGGGGGGGGQQGGGQQQGGGLPGGGVGGPSVPEITLRPRMVTVNEPRVIHTIYFRTSEFNRFENKVDAILDASSSHQNVQQIPKIHFYSIEAIGPAEMGAHSQLDSAMVSIVVDESETWTTTTGIKPDIVDLLPFGSGPGGEGSLPNKSQWNALEFRLPYKGNRFKERTNTSAHLELISAEDYNNGGAVNVNSGTTLEFGFPYYCKVNLGDIQDLTEDTWEDLMDDFYDLYGHPDNWDYEYLEPATDCFQGMHDDYEDWLPFEDDDPYEFDPDAFPPQHWWEMDVLNSNQPCSMPQKFFDIWRVVRDYPTTTSYHGATYPTNFKLILPGEKHIRVVQRQVFIQ
jgi:hypothetical protein